tara:strand:- start:283 stop:549 length:267 start_codon:yes stop_codon:yes gene_type:complete
LINLKLRIEQIGLFTSLFGIASVLQPFTLLLYSYGFYILVIGAVLYFIGGIIPEEENTGKAIIKVELIIGLSILILLLTIYLSPSLIG